MKKIQLTLEEISDKAGITVEELLALAKREPLVASLIANAPRGEPNSGIPPDPSMYGKLSKCVLDSELDSEFSLDSEFDDE
jgi:hypothetical protein